MTKNLMKLAAALLALTMLTAAAGAETISDNQRLDIYYSLSLSYINRAEYEKALQYLDATLEYCDEASNAELYADVHLKKGCVYTLQADYASAVAELDEAIRVQPDLSEAYLVKTQVYTETEDYAAAAESLERYISLSGSASMYETLAQLYTQGGNTEKALEYYRAYLEASNVEGVQNAYNMGLYKLENGRYEEAVSDFEACLEDADYGPTAAYNIGVCYMRNEDYEKAITAFAGAVEKNAKVDGVQYNIGICYMMLDQMPEAIAAFTVSMETESYAADAQYNRAICYVNSEEYQLAVDDFTSVLQALAVQPEPAEENVEAAAAEETEPAEETETAEGTEPGEAAVAEAVEQQPLEAVNTATYYRGVCYLSLGEYEKAAADFTACMENGVSPESSQYNRGLCFMQNGQYEESRDDLTASIENGFNADESLYYRSFVYRYLGDNEAALADLTACIERGYNLGQAYYQRAQVYSEMNDEEHYIQDLEMALSF